MMDAALRLFVPRHGQPGRPQHMKEETSSIHPDDIYVRTEAGQAAVDDVARALSAGFREMLRAVDGKCKVSELGTKFPRLDDEDVALWLGELQRMGLIDMAELPFELPELKAGKGSAPVPASAPAATGIDEFDIAAMAANVEEWLRQDTDSFQQMRKTKVDLSKTVQAAALQSTQALATLQNSGFFANLMEPLKLVGRQPVPAPAAGTPARVAPAKADPPSRVPLGRKGLALVFESDPADTALLARLLNEAGYQAQLCNSRQQLLLLLNQPLVPEVIFLKLDAKDVDAFKVLEKLRTHPRLGKAAVVMMAEAPSREDIAKSILLGASGWINKPYSAGVIAAAMNGVLTFPQG
jgi:CheY-like chemotaxis protein